MTRYLIHLLVSLMVAGLYLFYDTTMQVAIFTLAIQAILIAITIGLAIACLIQFIKKRTLSASIVSVMVMAGLGLYIYFRDAVPVSFIFYESMRDFNRTEITFRKDGTYRFLQLIEPIGFQEARGRYTFRDSEVTLDPDNILGFAKCRKYVIRKDSAGYFADPLSDDLDARMIEYRVEIRTKMW